MSLRGKFHEDKLSKEVVNGFESRAFDRSEVPSPSPLPPNPGERIKVRGFEAREGLKMKRIYAAIVILTAVSLIFLPALAEAGGGERHGGHAGWHSSGWYPGWGLGFGAGLFAGYLLAPRIYATPAPACYQTVPGHWESRWDPYWQRYINIYVPPYTTAYPCP
jgi:hypothetical protein